MKKERGFTLIEVLIAVTISGLIIVGIINLYNLGISNMELVKDSGSLQQESRVFMNVIKRDLHNIFSSEIYKENLFESSNQELSFLKIDEEIFQRVEYNYDSYNNLLSRKVYKNTENISEEEMSILNFFTEIQLDDIQFTYYDLKNRYWRNNWSYKNQGNLPRAIMISIYFDSGKKIDFTADILQERIYSS